MVMFKIVQCHPGLTCKISTESSTKMICLQQDVEKTCQLFKLDITGHREPSCS